MKHQESNEQILVFQWASYYPILRWMHASANGGKRSKREAARMKREGVKAGISDICLPLPMNGYHGLYIELKRRKLDGTSKVSGNQAAFLRDMEILGYKAVVCFGADEAIAVIKEYANI